MNKCKTSYDLNFNTVQLTIQNISKLKINSIPDFEIFTVRFPCQPYSIAGKRQALHP